MTPPTGPWVCYQTVFASQGPIHIGWHTLGLIERTRYYIPARAIWGTLIANLAPRLNRKPQVSAMYDETKKEFTKTVRFTSFFATDPACQPPQILRPKYLDKGLYYGNLTAAEFESRFVFSQTSAALNPDTFTALDGALHESEFLSYTSPDGKPTAQTLHFTGYLIFKQSLTNMFATALRTISVGADRNYGWGRLHLSEFKPHSGPIFDDFQTDLSSAYPLLKTNKPGAFLPAHLLHEKDKTNLEGDLELIAGRDWSPKGSGQALPSAALCWAPGSKIPAKDAKFEILSEGLWSAL